MEVSMPPEAVTSKELGPVLGMYSHAVVAPAGEIVVVAGQVGMDGAGRLVGPGDVVAQTKQAYANIERVLRAAGSSMRDVVPGYYPDGVYPPNTLLVVSRLVQPELRVEIEAMAVKPARAAAVRPAMAGAKTKSGMTAKPSGQRQPSRKHR